MPVCEKHGKEGWYVCPECGERVDVYSRIVGYMRPIHLWNDGKVQEFEDRLEYKIFQEDK